MLKKIAAGCLVMLWLLMAGCSIGEQGNEKVLDSAQNRLVVYSSSPVWFSTPLIQEFEKSTGIKVDLVQRDTGSLLRQVTAEQEQPVADVLWTGSLHMMQEQQQLFMEYQSLNEPFIKAEFKNTEGCLTRFTEIPSVIIVNTKLIGDIQIEGYQDLLQPALFGKIAFAAPQDSSSSFEHLVNMLYAMGNGNPEHGWSYIEKFCSNLAGKLLRTSDEVYQGVADGSFIVGCTFEQNNGKIKDIEAPIKVIYMTEGVVTVPDSMQIVRNARNVVNAKRFVDFMTSKNTQSFIAQKFYRRSVREDVSVAVGLPEKTQFKLLPINDQAVVASRKMWLDRFQAVFIHNL